jgi:hypothetical protein
MGRGELASERPVSSISLAPYINFVSSLSLSSSFFAHNASLLPLAKHHLYHLYFVFLCVKPRITTNSTINNKQPPDGLSRDLRRPASSGGDHRDRDVEPCEACDRGFTGWEGAFLYSSSGLGPLSLFLPWSLSSPIFRDKVADDLTSLSFLSGIYAFRFHPVSGSLIRDDLHTGTLFDDCASYRAQLALALAHSQPNVARPPRKTNLHQPPRF